MVFSLQNFVTLVALFLHEAMPEHKIWGFPEWGYPSSWGFLH